MQIFHKIDASFVHQKKFFRRLSIWKEGQCKRRTTLGELINLSLLGRALKGVHIKYVGGKFVKKNFVAQETIYVNISWGSNFLIKYFMAPLINFSFLLEAYLLQQYFRVALTTIFKFQITKEVNIHNNIEKIIFK